MRVLFSSILCVRSANIYEVLPVKFYLLNMSILFHYAISATNPIIYRCNYEHKYALKIGYI